MALFSGLSRETTRDLLVRARVGALAMLLFGAMLGASLVYFWDFIVGNGDPTERLLYAGASGLPLLFAVVVYIYLTAGVLPTLRERIDSLKRSAESAEPF